jgi:probable phosphoglycerate mutase
VPPGGESFTEVRRRVLRARDQLLARYPRQTVLVVTHVTPTKVLVADAVDAPLSALYRMELSPATLTEVQWYAGGQASLRRFNDAAHLL